MRALNRLQDVAIGKIQIERDTDTQALINLQESSMVLTWDSETDKAWDELYDW